MTKRILMAAVAAVFAAGVAANEQSRAGFSELDKNGDGMISRSEWEAMRGSSAAARGAQQQAQKGQRQGQDKGSAALVLMPVVVTQAADFSDGCWARLYDDQNFSGNALTVTGPAQMPNLRTGGTDWSGSFNSLQVGPKATLTVYDNENYTQKTATYRANQRVAELDETRGWFDDIRSLKMTCAGKQQAGAGRQAGDASQDRSTGN